MPKRHLTAQFIRNLEPQGKRIEYYDQHLIEDNILKGRGVKSLFIRLTKAGNVYFYYRYWMGGKSKSYKLGSYPDLSLSEARDKARDIAGKVNEGIDPQAEKKARKATPEPEIITVRDLAEDFKRDYLPQKKQSTQASYRSRINRITEKFGSTPIDDLTGRQVRRWLKEVAADQPTNANRIQAIFSKMYSYATDPKQSYTSHDPLKGMDKQGEEIQRNPTYSDSDIKDLWEAFEAQGKPMGSLLKMLMITGQRLGETSRMRWSDIDRGLWIIPREDTKGNRTHVVPLPGLAVELLQGLPKESEYVFASPMKDSGPLTHFNSVTERIRDITGLADFRIHDLRHIAITGMIRLGVDMVHVGRTVAHKGLGKEQVITNRYSHYEFMDEKEQALAKWSYKLQQIVSGKKANINKIA